MSNKPSEDITAHLLAPNEAHRWRIVRKHKATALPPPGSNKKSLEILDRIAEIVTAEDLEILDRVVKSSRESWR